MFVSDGALGQRFTLNWFRKNILCTILRPMHICKSGAVSNIKPYAKMTIHYLFTGCHDYPFFSFYIASQHNTEFVKEKVVSKTLPMSVGIQQLRSSIRELVGNCDCCV